MELKNQELSLFQSLKYPYSIEFGAVRKQIKPNLKIENERQSLFSVIKYIRNDLILKKLKDSKALVFDKYINEILGLDIDVDAYYPPSDLNKLDKFVSELKAQNISELELNLVLYYILKDYSFTRADEFITNIVSSDQYNFINSIYFLDRFDLLKSLHYLNSLDQFNINSKSFINHIIRLANIIPFQPEISINSIVDISQIQSYLEIKSTNETSLSALSIFTSLNINPLLQDLDILLIYLDSITNVSVNESLNFYKSIVANYSSDLPISLDLIFKIILIKILIKTYRQREEISALKSKIVDNYILNQFFESLPIFQLFNYPQNDFIEDQIITNLYQILNNLESEEEKSLRSKFPNFWKKLDDFNKEIKSIARDLLVLKEVLSIDTDSQEILNLSNIGTTQKVTSFNPKHIQLKDLVNYLQ